MLLWKIDLLSDGFIIPLFFCSPYVEEIPAWRLRPSWSLVKPSILADCDGSHGFARHMENVSGEFDLRKLYRELWIWTGRMSRGICQFWNMPEHSELRGYFQQWKRYTQDPRLTFPSSIFRVRYKGFESFDIAASPFRFLATFSSNTAIKAQTFEARYSNMHEIKETYGTYSVEVGDLHFNIKNIW